MTRTWRTQAVGNRFDGFAVVQEAGERFGLPDHYLPHFARGRIPTAADRFQTFGV